MIHELKVDLEQCVHCKQCLEVCYTNVIGWNEELGIPYAQYPLDCQLCCVCEDACPQKAITVIPDWSLKYYPAYLSEAAQEAIR